MNSLVLDESLRPFEFIPQFVPLDGMRIAVSRISDRLACACAELSNPLPPFIRLIKSSFRAIHHCPPILEFPRSIDAITGFFQVCKLRIVQIATESRLYSIKGFTVCEALERITFPESILVVDGFNQCLLTLPFDFWTGQSGRETQGILLL
jgi:hypothetical protein